MHALVRALIAVAVLARNTLRRRCILFQLQRRLLRSGGVLSLPLVFWNDRLRANGLALGTGLLLLDYIDKAFRPLLKISNLVQKLVAPIADVPDEGNDFLARHIRELAIDVKLSAECIGKLFAQQLLLEVELLDVLCAGREAPLRILENLGFLFQLR